MRYAVAKSYLPTDLEFHGLPKYLRRVRDGLTLEQGKHLLAVTRQWVAQARPAERWHRQMTVHFLHIMLNTGMRPGECRRLRWRDVARAQDRNGDPINLDHTLRTAGTRVEVIYLDEGNSLLNRAADRIVFLTALQSFLAKNLSASEMTSQE